ncbi:MAG: GvpL/GvpF family gas vesicle protein [Solirubrobacteraceae bacterium]
MPDYVYGIVEADARAPSAPGVADAPVRLVAGDGAAALVSDMPAGEARLDQEAIMAHARVLDAAIATGTVLPMRFGVVMSGPDEIRRRLLEDHADEIEAQLGELDGKVEIRIRASYDQDALLREVLHEDPDIQTLRRSLQGRPQEVTYYARIELGERVAAGIERMRERDRTAILDALAPAALALDEAQTRHERVVLNASFLVQRAALKRFDVVLEEVAAANGGRIRFKYTGPLPPHSFVTLAESA